MKSLRRAKSGYVCTLAFAALLGTGCGSDAGKASDTDGGSGGNSGASGDGGETGSGATSSAGGGPGGASGNHGNSGAMNAGGVSPGGAGVGGSNTGGKNGTSGGASSGGRAANGGTSGAPSGGASSGGAANGGTSSGGTSNGGTGGAALVNPPAGSKFFVGANFWNIDWEGQGDFFQSNVDFSTTTNPWTPAFLADLAPYHVLRFMDWNQTNNSNNSQANWDTRKQKADKQNEPVAFEWQIDLCNRTKKDYWLNVPHEATPDYWTKLAGLVKDQLDPSLRVYLEYSNEVWNGGFPQSGYAADKAKSLNLSGSIASASYYVYASVRLYESFEAVFGKGSPRLVKVLAGQAAWTGPCDAQMIALKDATINPKGTMPSVYAIAPYFGGKTTTELGSALPTVNDWTSSSKKCSDGVALPLISYEGGSDSFAAGNACTTVQHDPAMHDLYTSYFTGIAGAGMKGPFMQYTHTGSCWGLKEKTSDSLDNSPKYKGVLDWLAAHP